MSLSSTFRETVVVDADAPRFVHRSGLLSYHEVFRDGSLRGRGWELNGFLSDEGDLPSLQDRVRTDAFRLTVNGVDTSGGWELRGHAVTDAGSTITLAHTAMPLEVDVVTDLTGASAVRRRLRLRNISADLSLVIGEVVPLGGLLWTPAQFAGGAAGEHAPDVRLGYMQSQGWGREGDFGFCSLPESELVISGRYRRGPHRHPIFIASPANTGLHFVGQLGWSGGYTMAFDYERGVDVTPGPRARASWLRFELAMDAPHPQLVLRAGESMDTAAAYLGGSASAADDAFQAVIDTARELAGPRVPEHLGTVQAGIGPEQEITTAAAIWDADSTSSMKPDVFYIDANWYSGPGEDWFDTAGDWNKGTRWSGGLDELAENVRGRGMTWGLWMEPERVGKSSAAFATLAHMIATDRHGRQPERALLDLSRPEVCAHIESEIERVITENDLGFFRIDFNLGHLGDGFVNDVDGVPESSAWRYYDALYRMFGRLRARFPEVIFQNCASGGARTDWGMVSQFDDTWVTDWQLAPRSFSIVNGMSMALSPELIDRHVGMGMRDHLTGDLDFQLNLALFGRPTVSWLSPRPARRNPLLIERVERMVSEYRTWIQPWRERTRILHHTPVADGDWGVIERVCGDGDISVVGLFRLAELTPQDRYVVRPRGLHRAATYRVHIDGELVDTGVRAATLQHEGISVQLSSALSSALVVFEQEA